MNYDFVRWKEDACYIICDTTAHSHKRRITGARWREEGICLGDNERAVLIEWATNHPLKRKSPGPISWPRATTTPAHWRKQRASCKRDQIYERGVYRDKPRPTNANHLQPREDWASSMPLSRGQKLFYKRREREREREVLSEWRERLWWRRVNLSDIRSISVAEFGGCLVELVQWQKDISDVSLLVVKHWGSRRWERLIS